MELYFLRHAIAVERGVPGFRDDRKRPLTRKGAQKMRRIAKGMRRLGLDFDLILSSPYVRAKCTAEIVAAAFDAKEKLQFSNPLAADADSQRLIAELKKSHRPRKSILLVGHEPFMSQLISVLLTGNRAAQVVLKKGGLCKLTIGSLRHGPCAKLEWLLTPRQLVRIGKA